MSRYRFYWALAPIAALALTFGMACPAAAQGSPTDVTRDFYTALFAGDYNKALSLVDPDGIYIENPTLYEHKHSLKIFVDELGKGGYQLTINSNVLQENGTVVSDLSVTGGDFAGLAHPARATLTATVESGKITSILAIFSDQTLMDLGIIQQSSGAQPGMPQTGGGGDSDMIWVVTAVAALCCVVGLAMRQNIPQS